ncbi:hypothetical protein [Aminobacter ciceronei]|uniref:hypothetical protein n=1 Tax=Aminobacter ciceronei TaxID=150723 RepID=UPI0015FA7517|nr:hypothetical protein [Aminobacter ciceronei]
MPIALSPARSVYRACLKLINAYVENPHMSIGQTFRTRLPWRLKPSAFRERSSTAADAIGAGSTGPDPH